jgi:hypothetical protein
MQFGDINVVYFENPTEYLKPVWKACRALPFKADVTCNALWFKGLTRNRLPVSRGSGKLPLLVSSFTRDTGKSCLTTTMECTWSHLQ